jgi:hypothetical protein
MQFTADRRRLPGLISCFWLATALTACGGSHEETVAGVQVPVPSGMTKSEEKGVELSLPGFGGGQAMYRGKREPGEVVEFYKKELPERGWVETEHWSGF